MTWFFAILIVLAMGGVAVVASGRGGSLPEAYDDRPDVRIPADGPLSSDDVRGVRFSLGLRGYRMSEVDALLERLAAVSDAVVENYARDVLPKLGLDYPVLRRSRPGLVMLSMPAFGAEGPWRDARAYGSTLEHASGLPTVSGPADAPPTTNQLAYGDPVGGLNAAAALLVALLHRQRTGVRTVHLAEVLASSEGAPHG